MLIHVPLSTGEVLDKITILEIKSERISDAGKLENIHNELSQLQPLVAGAPFDSDELKALIAELKSINEELWVIEDDIREQERESNFGEVFIALARAVYVTNDRRADVKKRINLATGSDLVEEKSYEDYTGNG
ncbi:DUF6165 family protein [Alphaproteobacteria bacterium]|jgi:hypothetical protein|nr:DUF6165 family protein [Alphaproteobacteria bacterium]